MKTTFAVIGFVVVAMVVGTCVACTDDEDETSWVPVVERSERPGGRDGPGREGECDGSCGNQHRDCENNTGECSDDDQVMIAPVICVEPGSCRF